MATNHFLDSSTAFFRVEIDGVEVGNFQEITGLEASIGTEDVEEGGVNGYVHKLPGRMSWPNITLKRGFTNNDALFEWLGDASGSGFAKGGNKTPRKTAAVILLDGSGKQLRKWSFIDVIPVRWGGPTFAASGAEALVEELEMAHHGFTVE